MPKETFHRLPEEKKKIILDAFFEEFAINSYNNASISKVVAKLGIAKGSIYQYFENKKDLYLYLLEYATKLRLEKLDEYFNPEKNDFFDQLIENFSRKIIFDLEHPVHSGFLFNVLNERNNKALGNLNLQMKKWLLKITTDIVHRYITAGKLNPLIDPEIAAFMIIETQVSVFDYLVLKYNIDFNDNIRKKQPVLALKQEEVMAIIKKIAYIFKNGLKRNL